MLQTLNVAYNQCYRCSMLQSNVQCCNCWHATFKTLFTAMTEQPRACYIYAYTNDIHTVATNVLLIQQLSHYSFLVMFKSSGLTAEPGLATKIRAKALSFN